MTRRDLCLLPLRIIAAPFRLLGRMILNSLYWIAQLVVFWAVLIGLAVLIPAVAYAIFAFLRH